MQILLSGATGFIGRRVHAALAGRGHQVVAIARTPPPVADDRTCGGTRWVRIDFTQANRVEHWLPALESVDVVINAAGTFAGSGRASMLEAVHTAAPSALFRAAEQARVRRIVQLSALGAEAGAPTPFLRTKHAADELLLALPVSGAVVRPSLVFGPDGASTRMLAMLASMPWLVLPDGGRALVQPIHVDDLVEALCELAVGAGQAVRGRIDAVGPEPLSFAAYLDTLRRQLGLGPARVVGVPGQWLSPAAAIAERLWPDAPVGRDALRMLSGGSVADAKRIGGVLQRPPRAPGEFVSREWREPLRTRALLGWLLPMLRLAIAFVWIVTGVVSLAVFPVAESHALLARAGIAPAWQHPMLLAAGWADLALGVLTLVAPYRWVWAMQALLIVVYSAIIAVFLPEFWIHPFGPLVKNVPILALLWLLWTLDANARKAQTWNT